MPPFTLSTRYEYPNVQYSDILMGIYAARSAAKWGIVHREGHHPSWESAFRDCGSYEVTMDSSLEFSLFLPNGFRTSTTTVKICKHPCNRIVVPNQPCYTSVCSGILTLDASRRLSMEVSIRGENFICPRFRMQQISASSPKEDILCLMGNHVGMFVA